MENPDSPETVEEFESIPDSISPPIRLILILLTYVSFVVVWIIGQTTDDENLDILLSYTYLILPSVYVLVGILFLRFRFSLELLLIGLFTLIPFSCITIGVLKTSELDKTIWYGIYFAIAVIYFAISYSGIRTRWRNILRQLSKTMIVACFILLIAGYTSPSLVNARRSVWENRCRLTLRSLGSSQLHYASGHYGKLLTWNEMFKDLPPEQSYTRENIIDQYNIVIFNLDYEQTNDPNEFWRSRFTFVAVPKNPRKKLRTFALCEDQMPRVWIGNSEDWTTDVDLLRNEELWEPLR